MFDAGVSLGKWGGILLAVVLSVLAVAAYFYGIPGLLDHGFGAGDANDANDAPATPMQADIESMLATLAGLEGEIGAQHHAARVAQRAAQQEFTELQAAQQAYGSVATALREAMRDSAASSVTLFGETFQVSNLAALAQQWEQETGTIANLVQVRETTIDQRGGIVASLEESLTRVRTDREALQGAWESYRDSLATLEAGETPAPAATSEEALLDLLTTIHRRNGTYEPVVDTTGLDDSSAPAVRQVLSRTAEAHFRQMLPTYQR